MEVVCLREADPRLERLEPPLREPLRWGGVKVEPFKSVDMRKAEDESLGEDMVSENVESLGGGGDGAMVLDWNWMDWTPEGSLRPLSTTEWEDRLSAKLSYFCVKGFVREVGGLVIVGVGTWIGAMCRG